jgi:hypothetical protein
MVNAVMGGVLSLIGMVSRKKYDLDISGFYVKLLLIAGVLLGIMQSLNGLGSYYYLSKAFKLS